MRGQGCRLIDRALNFSVSRAAGSMQNQSTDERDEADMILPGGSFVTHTGPRSETSGISCRMDVNHCAEHNARRSRSMANNVMRSRSNLEDRNTVRGDRRGLSNGFRTQSSAIVVPPRSKRTVHHDRPAGSVCSKNTVHGRRTLRTEVPR